MHNLSISDLNSIQFDEKFTGQLLVNVENGRIVRNYHLPDGAIAGSVEALLFRHTAGIYRVADQLRLSGHSGG